MLIEVMRSIHNHFAKDPTTDELYGSEIGLFALEDGYITVQSKYIPGQYIALQGSFLNDGVFRVESFVDGVISIASDVETQPVNEEWAGNIYSLKVPSDFLRLVQNIEEFIKNDAGHNSNVLSASFGVQSMTFAANKSGFRAGWRDVYENELHRFRRMTADIKL